MVIDWLREASIAAVSRRLELTWHEVDGIMLRAVVRGLACRELVAPQHWSVDETSFQKRAIANASYGCDFVGNAHLKAGGNASAHAQRVNAARQIAYDIAHILNGAAAFSVTIPKAAGSAVVDPSATFSLAFSTGLSFLV